MSKPVTNPFFGVDFSKFPDFSKIADFSKISTDFKTPFNVEPLLAAQRRNIEAFTAANQAVNEGLQTLARRQVELVRQSIEEAGALVNSLISSPGTPEEKVLRQAEASKAVVEKCIANAREVAETLNKYNAQALEVVTSRLNESLEELRKIIKPQSSKED
jgi:phasin family protein